MEQTRSAKKLFQSIWNMQESSIILLTVVYVLVVQCINGVFLGQDNIINMLRSSAYLLIPSLGMTFVLIAGQIDLSVCTVMEWGAFYAV